MILNLTYLFRLHDALVHNVIVRLQVVGQEHLYCDLKLLEGQWLAENVVVEVVDELRDVHVRLREQLTDLRIFGAYRVYDRHELHFLQVEVHVEHVVDEGLLGGLVLRLHGLLLLKGGCVRWIGGIHLP